MPTYTVKSPLRHDGELYAEGDSVEMAAKTAKPLLEAGVLTEEAKAKVSTETTAQDEGEPAAKAATGKKK